MVFGCRHLMSEKNVVAIIRKFLYHISATEGCDNLSWRIQVNDIKNIKERCHGRKYEKAIGIVEKTK